MAQANADYITSRRAVLCGAAALPILALPAVAADIGSRLADWQRLRDEEDRIIKAGYRPEHDDRLDSLMKRRWAIEDEIEAMPPSLATVYALTVIRADDANALDVISDHVRSAVRL